MRYENTFGDVEAALMNCNTQSRARFTAVPLRSGDVLVKCKFDTEEWAYYIRQEDMGALSARLDNCFGSDEIFNELEYYHEG